jgi:hypothetical protein
MSAPTFIRPGSIVAAVIAVTIGFVNMGFDAAIVGETRRVFVKHVAVTNIDAMKAVYRRSSFSDFD